MKEANNKQTDKTEVMSELVLLLKTVKHDLIKQGLN